MINWGEIFLELGVGQGINNGGMGESRTTAGRKAKKLCENTMLTSSLQRGGPCGSSQTFHKVG